MSKHNSVTVLVDRTELTSILTDAEKLVVEKVMGGEESLLQDGVMFYLTSLSSVKEYPDDKKNQMLEINYGNYVGDNLQVIWDDFYDLVTDKDSGCDESIIPEPEEYDTVYSAHRKVYDYLQREFPSEEIINALGDGFYISDVAVAIDYLPSRSAETSLVAIEYEPTDNPFNTGQ